MVANFFSLCAVLAVHYIIVVLIGADADEESYRGAGVRILHPEILYCSLELQTTSALACRQEVDVLGSLKVGKVRRSATFEMGSEKILNLCI